MNERALTVQESRLPARPAADVLEHTRQLGFPIRVLGQNNGLIVPQVVGNWWLEPLGPQTHLPPRARHRLETVLAAGITPKAVVVFHELPKEPGEPSRWVKLAAQCVEWARHQVAERAQQREQARAERRRQRLDPCLVVVLADGSWVELDRWDS